MPRSRISLNRLSSIYYRYPLLIEHAYHEGAKLGQPYRAAAILLPWDGAVPGQSSRSVQHLFDRTGSFKGGYEPVIGLATEAVSVALLGLGLDEPSTLDLGVVTLRRCRQELQATEMGV